MATVLLYEFHACSLSVKNMFVLGIDLAPGFSIVFLSSTFDMSLVMVSFLLLREFNILCILNLGRLVNLDSLLVYSLAVDEF
jgi:hypothetical protein